MSVNVSFPDFSGGEISPKFYGRHDLKAYYNSCRRLQNFIPDTIGTAQFRTGTFYAAGTKSNNKAFLYTFQYDDEVSYVLEFTNLKLRFYRNDGLIESGGSPVEVTTPFAEAHLFQLKFAQSGNTLYIAHPSYNPQKLVFTSSTSWAITAHSPTGLTLSAGNYPSAVGFYEQRLFYGGSTNSPLTLYGSGSATPDVFTTGTEPDEGIAYTIAGGTGKINWLTGTKDFLALGTNGDVYQVTGGVDQVITPTSISIRPTNAFGVADINPVSKGNNIYYMQSNNLVMRSFEYIFERDSYVPVDKNTISEHITKSGITQITAQEARPSVIWGVRADGVAIGLTLEDTESISGFHRFVTDGEVISVAHQSRPSAYDQVWFCIKRNIGGTDYYYVEYMTDPVVFPRYEDYVDLENTEGEILSLWRNQMYEAQKDYIHMDCAISYRGDDNSVTMTPDATTGTDVTFTASDSLFSSGDVGRQIWKKSITGNEYGRAEIISYTSATEVQCNILETFDSTDEIPATEWYFTTDTLEGADHLEGETVTVIADGAQHPNVTVDSGVIQLTQQVSVAHAGLKFIGYLETNDLEGGGMTGPAQTKKKNLLSVGIRFLDSMFVKYGTTYTQLNDIPFRTASMLMDRPPEPFTGDVEQKYNNDSNDPRDGGWSRSKRVIVVQDQPFPCNIQLLIPYFQVTN